MIGSSFDKIFAAVAEPNIPYLSQWYLDTSVVVTPEKYAKFRQIQHIIYLAILYYVEHCYCYRKVIPLTGFVEELLDLCSPYPYRPGTYRPDFLLEDNGEIKICEIGARFPLNGYCLSGIAELIGIDKFPQLPHKKDREYTRFFNYLFEYWGEGFDTVCVLKGDDRPGDMKYYTPLFEELGLTVIHLSPEKLLQNMSLLHKSAVINEFNQKELEHLPKDVLKCIAASNSLNDMRTIFLIHDKRFMALLSDQEFLSAFLPQDQIDIIKNIIIPTYTYVQAFDKWNEAKRNREGWVLKHSRLGKSEKVYVGHCCPKKEWEAIFSSPEIKDMVLQPFIKQRRVDSSIGDNLFRDYVVGMLLCFDDNFFGPGIFRTSSYEITNKIDDRKMASCIVSTEDIYNNHLYI